VSPLCCSMQEERQTDVWTDRQAAESHHVRGWRWRRNDVRSASGRTQ